MASTSVVVARHAAAVVVVELVHTVVAAAGEEEDRSREEATAHRPSAERKRKRMRNKGHNIIILKHGLTRAYLSARPLAFINRHCNAVDSKKKAVGPAGN